MSMGMGNGMCGYQGFNVTSVISLGFKFEFGCYLRLRLHLFAFGNPLASHCIIVSLFLCCTICLLQYAFCLLYSVYIATLSLCFLISCYSAKVLLFLVPYFLRYTLIVSCTFTLFKNSFVYLYLYSVHKQMMYFLSSSIFIWHVYTEIDIHL